MNYFNLDKYKHMHCIIRTQGALQMDERTVFLRDFMNSTVNEQQSLSLYYTIRSTLT